MMQAFAPLASDRDGLAARREITKWLALVAMVVDHLGKTVLPSLVLPFHFAGRLALPLFALVIAERLASRPSLRGKYLRRLALWGLMAQPAYALVASEPEANIMFTLGLGVALDLAVERLFAPGWGGRALSLALGAVSLLLATRCDYGVPGVALVPALAALERWRPVSGSWAAGPLALLVNLVGSPAPFFVHGGALVASPMAAWLRETPVPLPRPHRFFFYAFYPLHLYHLAWWSLS